MSLHENNFPPKNQRSKSNFVVEYCKLQYKVPLRLHQIRIRHETFSLFWGNFLKFFFNTHYIFCQTITPIPGALNCLTKHIRFSSSHRTQPPFLFSEFYDKVDSWCWLLTIKYCERTFCCSNTPTLLALFDLHTVAVLGPWCLWLYNLNSLSRPVLVSLSSEHSSPDWTHHNTRNEN